MPHSCPDTTPSTSDPNYGEFLPHEDNLESEVDLLGDEPSDEDEFTGRLNPKDHAFITAPIFTGDVPRLLGASIFPQVGLYGQILSQHGHDLPVKPLDKRLFVNTNAPFSAVVCGVQGSGKSHTTSVLLETCLIQNKRLGTLPQPLVSLVFHYDTAAGGGPVQPSEAAYLSALDPLRGGRATPPPVTVLVLPNNLHAMKAVYARLPLVRVEPLHFAPQNISGERLLAMMKIDENAQMPLYMEAIMSILRSMEGCFDYSLFRRQLQLQKFNPGQKAMLKLRLSLLDSCLENGTTANSVVNHFKEGQLTIIDLSSPFMDGSSACGFFDIILGLFIESDVSASGKLVVLDEAHKYLSNGGTSSRLTESLLTVIRQQRHLATRVVISTQEPTVVPEKFLDLCSFIIAHRFSSPKWLKHLSEHIPSAGASSDILFQKVVSLGTGQAIIFSPNGLAVRLDDKEEALPNVVCPIGQGYLIVRSRLRITLDGGHSLLAVQNPLYSSRLSRLDDQSTPPLPAATTPNSETPLLACTATFLPRESIPPSTRPASAPNNTAQTMNDPPTVNAAVAESSQNDAQISQTVLSVDTAPIINFITGASKRGEHRLGQYYVLTYVWRTYGKAWGPGHQAAAAAIARSVSLGLIISESTSTGTWLYLPPSEPGGVSFGARVADEELYIWQLRGAITPSHELGLGVVPNLLKPMMRFIQHQSNRCVIVKKLVKHFRATVPSQPYGDQRTMIKRLIDYAAQLGLLAYSGNGKNSSVKLLDTVSI